jgi:hypothetical protein
MVYSAEEEENNLDLRNGESMGDVIRRYYGIPKNKWEEMEKSVKADLIGRYWRETETNV